MRRFEHPSGKFWSGHVDGTRVRVSWGKLGTSGQQRDIGLSTQREAKVKLAELIAKQIELGYVEVMQAQAIIATIRDGERWYRRFETRDRFVELVLDGRYVGERRGAIGEAHVDEHDSREDTAATATDRVAGLVHRLVADGFVIASEIEPPPAPEPGTSVLAHATNRELEAQCRAAPDSADTWSVYTDWLLAHDDLRGELAALRARGKEREADELFLKHRPQLFANRDELVQYVRITSWRHGFAVGANIKNEHDGDDLEAMTRDFLALPIAQFIEELRFGLAGFESNNDWGPTLEVVTSSAQAPWIRVLRFDDFTYEDQEISWTAFGDFSTAWPKLPRLEELRIRSGEGGTLGTIVLPALKTFVRVSGGLGASELESICGATWPELEHLEIWFGRTAYGAQGDVSRIQRILDGEGLPVLRHLGLVNCEFSDTIVSALAGSAILKRIRTLDLSNGIMADRAAAALVEHAAAFRHLEKIELEDNYLRPAELDRIAAVLPNVVRGDQRERDDLYDDEDPDEVDDRYAALGE